MKTFTLLSLVATNVLALEPSSLSILLPTAKPTITQDSWRCALENYKPFFQPPKPTGTLLSAIVSYGDKLIESCTELICPYPDATKWCSFTTAAPSAVLPAYTSYASTASVWWANHTSQAMDLAAECPHYWYDAMSEDPSAAVWLNQTIIMGDCIAKPHSGASSSGALSSSEILSTGTPLTTRPSPGTPSSSSPAVSSTLPYELSVDGTCGGVNGYVCPGSGFGECCSSYGWCGNEATHCQAGCQLNYGFCEKPSKISPDGSCGNIQNNNGYICPGSGFGDCCSAYGWCGAGSGNCGGGCQSAFGTCDAAVNTLTAREFPTSLVEPAATRVGVTMTTLVATGTNQMV